MTKATGKPKRHPTFTIDELKAIQSALIFSGDSASRWSASGPEDKNEASALEKVVNSIAYREDAAKRKALRKNVFTGEFNPSFADYQDARDDA